MRRRKPPQKRRGDEATLRQKEQAMQCPFLPIPLVEAVAAADLQGDLEGTVSLMSRFAVSSLSRGKFQLVRPDLDVLVMLQGEAGLASSPRMGL